MNQTEQLAPTAHKLLILLWAATPDRPDSYLIPFTYAAVAAAMDCEVEMHFTGTSVRLLVEGVAARLTLSQAEGKSIYHLMQQAAQQGVRFLGCSMALAEHLAEDEIKIAEFSGTTGAATFIMRALDANWRSLTF